MIALLASCALDGAGAPIEWDDPPGLVESEPVSCPDPSARDDAPMDLVELPDWNEVVAPRSHGGVVADDLDGDGEIDLFTPDTHGGILYMGDGLGGFVNESAARLPSTGSPAWSASAADVDGDGDLDLFVGANAYDDEGVAGAQALWMNDGTGHFQTGPALIPGRVVSARGGAWADFDGDHVLDLYVATYDGEGPVDEQSPEGRPPGPDFLLKGLGAGDFEDQSFLLGNPESGYTYVGAWSDLDGDTWPDLYTLNDFGDDVEPNQVFRNMGPGGDFGFIQDEGSVLATAMRGMGLGQGDVNGDGHVDLLVSDYARVWLYLYDGENDYFDAASALGLLPDIDGGQVVAWGATLADLDNDGLLDAYVNFGQLTVGDVEGTPRVEPDALWLGRRAGCPGTAPCFSPDVAPAWGLDDPSFQRGVVTVDINHDGYLDVVTRDLHGPTSVHLSRCGTRAWLGVRVVGEGANVNGIGARVQIELDGHRQVRWIESGSTGLGGSSPSVAHFGLGKAEKVEVLTVTWPGGESRTWHDLSARQQVTVALR